MDYGLWTKIHLFAFKNGIVGVLLDGVRAEPCSTPGAGRRLVAPFIRQGGTILRAAPPARRNPAPARGRAWASCTSKKSDLRSGTGAIRQEGVEPVRGSGPTVQAEFALHVVAALAGRRSASGRSSPRPGGAAGGVELHPAALELLHAPPGRNSLRGSPGGRPPSAAASPAAPHNTEAPGRRCGPARARAAGRLPRPAGHLEPAAERRQAQADQAEQAGRERVRLRPRVARRVRRPGRSGTSPTPGRIAISIGGRTGPATPGRRVSPSPCPRPPGGSGAPCSAAAGRRSAPSGRRTSPSSAAPAGRASANDFVNGVAGKVSDRSAAKRTTSSRGGPPWPTGRRGPAAPGREPPGRSRTHSLPRTDARRRS